MKLDTAKALFEDQGIFHKEGKIMDMPSVIGYEKKFKLAWIATQLNLFIVCTDFGDEKITTDMVEEHLKRSFEYASSNYTGWPRGLQSALGVISIMRSSNVMDYPKEYAQKLKSGKKWAAFTIPAVYDSSEEKLYFFDSAPVWGAIYFSHFRKTLEQFA